MTAQDDADRRRYAARTLARRALLDLARDGGVPIVSYPLYPGAASTMPDVAPLAGLDVSRRIEIGAREHAQRYVRAAREEGHSWHDIGTALGLVPNGDAQQVGETVAEAAFTYAAGHPYTEHARRYGRSTGWTCGSCDRTVVDYGPDSDPIDSERGHADNCGRQAAHAAELEAEREAFDADWEAGR